MNRFGRFALEAWRTQAPSAFAALTNPEAHFAQLGEDAESAWAQLWPEMVGPDTAGEDMMHKAGRINNARLSAEEQIRADMLEPPEELIEDNDGPDEYGVLYLETRRNAFSEEGL